MGDNVNRSTEGIFDAILAFGIVENQDIAVSRGDLIEELPRRSHPRRSTSVKRLMDNVKEWIGDEALISEVVNNSNTYEINRGHLSPDSYKDMLGVLLSLYPIRKSLYDRSIEELCALQHRGTIGIVSQIIKAIDSQNPYLKTLKIQYDGVRNRFHFRPDNLYKSDEDVWVVSGEFKEDVMVECPLEIRKIESLRQA